MGARAEKLDRDRVAARSGTWSMSIATSSPRARASRERRSASAGAARPIFRALRALRQKRSTQPTLIGLTTTVSGCVSASAAAASSQFPACAVARTTPRLSPAPRRARRATTRPATRAPRRGPPDARRARASRDAQPSEQYIVAATSPTRAWPTPARLIECSTCTRRMRRSVPTTQPRKAPSAGIAVRGRPPTAPASQPPMPPSRSVRVARSRGAARSAEAGTTSRLPDCALERRPRRVLPVQRERLATRGACVDELPVDLHRLDARHRQRHPLVPAVERERRPFGDDRDSRPSPSSPARSSRTASRCSPGHGAHEYLAFGRGEREKHPTSRRATLRQAP